MGSTRTRRYLPRILLLFGLLALAFSLLVPFGEHPDETDHYDYVRYLLTHRRLPLQSTDPAQNPVLEGHQPPGYYALVALLTGWASYEPYHPHVNPYLPRGRDDAHIVQQLLHPAAERFPWQGALRAAHVARLVSIGLGLLGVWITYRAGKLAAPDVPQVAWLAAGIHAFVPQFAFMSAGINNDNAAALLGSLITWHMLRLLRRPTYAGFGLLGALMGLGVLAKVSLLALLPAVGWTVWCVVAARPGVRGKVKEIAIRGGLIVVPLLLLAGWWMVRNLRLYDDPLGWNIWLITNAPSARRLPITGLYVLQFWWRQFRSFWGVFGWGRIFMPSWLYLLLGILTLLGLAGGIKYLVARRSSRATRRFILLGLVFAGLWLSTWRLGLALDAVASQGRFLFPALSAVATLLSVGWLAWWSPERRSRVGRLCVAGLFALSAAALLWRIVPAFARPLLPARAGLGRPVQATFKLWELVGWDAPQPVAGQTWPVTFYWRARWELEPEERALAPFLFVHLVADDGQALAKWDGVPTRGRMPPPAWGPAEVVVDTVRLSLPDRGQATLAHLWVGFYYREQDRLNRVTVRSSTHPTLPGTLVLGPVMVRLPEPPHWEPQRMIQARFGPIEMLGFDLQAEPQALRLTLYWRAREDVGTDYTVFAHLVDAEGLAAQKDGPPCGGQCPTALWRAGDVWRDVRLIPTDALTAADAPYSLSVGWYEPASDTRLPAWSAQGKRYADDRLPLCIFSWPDGTCR